MLAHKPALQAFITAMAGATRMKQQQNLHRNTCVAEVERAFGVSPEKQFLRFAILRASRDNPDFACAQLQHR